MTNYELREVKRVAAVNKLQANAGAASTAALVYQLPYAEAPHEQSLLWPGQKPVDTVQAGRMLNVALRVSSDAFTGQLERIAHNAREEEDKRLFDQFDAALKEHNIDSILLAVEKAKNQATMVIEGAVATAILWEHDHPCEELKAIVAGRKRQLGELNTFFVAISRGVTTGASAQAADKSNTYIMGAWAGFSRGYARVGTALLIQPALSSEGASMQVQTRNTAHRSTTLDAPYRTATAASTATRGQSNVGKTPKIERGKKGEKKPRAAAAADPRGEQAQLEARRPPRCRALDAEEGFIFPARSVS